MEEELKQEQEKYDGYVSKTNDEKATWEEEKQSLLEKVRVCMCMCVCVCVCMCMCVCVYIYMYIYIYCGYV